MRCMKFACFKTNKDVCKVDVHVTVLERTKSRDRKQTQDFDSERIEGKSFRRSFKVLLTTYYY